MDHVVLAIERAPCALSPCTASPCTVSLFVAPWSDVKSAHVQQVLRRVRVVSMDPGDPLAKQEDDRLVLNFIAHTSWRPLLSPAPATTVWMDGVVYVRVRLSDGAPSMAHAALYLASSAWRDDFGTDDFGSDDDGDNTTKE